MGWDSQVCFRNLHKHGEGVENVVTLRTLSALAVTACLERHLAMIEGGRWFRVPFKWMPCCAEDPWRALRSISGACFTLVHGKTSTKNWSSVNKRYRLLCWIIQAVSGDLGPCFNNIYMTPLPGNRFLSWSYRLLSRMVIWHQSGRGSVFSTHLFFIAQGWSWSKYLIGDHYLFMLQLVIKIYNRRLCRVYLGIHFQATPLGIDIQGRHILLQTSRSNAKTSVRPLKQADTPTIAYFNIRPYPFPVIFKGNQWLLQQDSGNQWLLQQELDGGTSTFSASQ